MTMKLIHTFEPTEAVVGMCTYRDHVYIATTSRIWRISEDADGEVTMELVKLREYMSTHNSDTQDALAEYDDNR